jgi:hypothetical protein
LERPQGYHEALSAILRKFDPVAACAAIDQRLEDLVTSRLMHAELNLTSNPSATTGPQKTNRG